MLTNLRVYFILFMILFLLFLTQTLWLPGYDYVVRFDNYVN